jgi:hypothetical protein
VPVENIAVADAGLPADGRVPLPPLDNEERAELVVEPKDHRVERLVAAEIGGPEWGAELLQPIKQRPGKPRVGDTLTSIGEDEAAVHRFILSHERLPGRMRVHHLRLELHQHVRLKDGTRSRLKPAAIAAGGALEKQLAARRDLVPARREGEVVVRLAAIAYEAEEIACAPERARAVVRAATGEVEGEG